jgi:hypothetical protein
VYVRIVSVFYLVEARVRFLKIQLRLNSAHNPNINTSLGFRQFYKFLQVDLGKIFDLFPKYGMYLLP